MTSITQDMKYRLSLIHYAEKYGVTKAAIKYKTNRQYIYRWKRRFDGSIESLCDRSRRPHFHPTTIDLWLISLAASKELSILLLKLLECKSTWYSKFILGLCART